ncbi:hypothetical protein BCR33DRAFT_724127 [Rhizoclosmatium globosum]|uniref:Enkurin domain-containing protein n=1 Tax=Rhizoclosmatium globosum TaxID=329046 RepID=A0A1Y2B9Y3_9FUNG|nr:hypothetical protein BCR33DRAFT_724127 [Rhizoclosmatium globosum]|eukprot:ORY30895.1 hypothetical protein BCR33DRAFT_724127 [Rhizoclosmatium globosum]
MAATIISHARTSRRRIPSDPLDESIYNMVLRPGIEDRPPPLFKSKFAQHVRSEHMKARRTVSLPSGPIPEQIARSAIPISGMVKNASVKSVSKEGKVKAKATASPEKAIKQHANRVNKTSSTAKPKKAVSTKIPAPKSVSKPISKPTSGRIAMAAERRSNAATPVVADTNAWDHLAADAAESTSPLKKGVNYEEIPEELIEHWEPFENDVDEAGRVMRRSSPPPTEMESGAVRKQAIKKNQSNKSGSMAMPAGSIGGGNRRRMLPEAERLASLLGIYNRLPVATDTVSKINRKISIEKQLALLEEDIKKFSHPNIIIDEGN